MCCSQAGHHALLSAVTTKVLAVASEINKHTFYRTPSTPFKVAIEPAVGRRSVIGTPIRGKFIHTIIRCADVGNVVRIGVGSATGLVGYVDVPARVTIVEVLLEDGPSLVGVLFLQSIIITAATTTEDHHVGNVRLRPRRASPSNEHHEHEQ